MEKKRKNYQRVLIIVHGGLPKWPKNPLVVPLVKKFREIVLGWFTSSRTMLMPDYHHFAENMRDDYNIIELLPWNGGFLKSDLDTAVKRLSKLLKQYKNYKVDLVAVSLGGAVVQEALKLTPDISINRILYLGAVHDGHHRTKNAKQIFNVYSKIDKMYFFANDVYEGMGNAFLKGENVVNLPIPGIRHDHLLINAPFKDGIVKDKKLFDFYKFLLNSPKPFS